jgi:hypothetical protein
MIPIEKAKELVNKYLHLFYDGLTCDQLKLCALIAANEAEMAELDILTKLEIITDKYTSDYWQQVKQEIKEL